MKFHNFFIFLITILSISSVICQGSTAENNMDSQHPAFTQNISPEHIPGSNMIGAGRGRRVQQWKATQATEQAHPPQQAGAAPAQPPQQQGAPTNQ